MALMFRSVEFNEPVVLSVEQRQAMAAFVTSIGADPQAACELRVWFEAPTTRNPRSGVLTAQVASVVERSENQLPVGAPFTCFETEVV